jgi:hypothetical protein
VPRVGTSTGDTLSRVVKAAFGELTKTSTNFSLASSSAKGAAANSSRSKISDFPRDVKVISNTKVIISNCRRRLESVVNTSVTFTSHSTLEAPGSELELKKFSTYDSVSVSNAPLSKPSPTRSSLIPLYSSTVGPGEVQAKWL